MTIPPPYVPQPSDVRGRSAADLPCDDAGNNPLLAFLPEAPAPSSADILPQRSSTSVDTVRRVAKRFWLAPRVRRPGGAGEPAAVDAANHRAGRGVCLVFAMGGVGVGALAMWLLSVPSTAVMPSRRPPDVWAAVAATSREERASAAPNIDASPERGPRVAAEHDSGVTSALAVSSKTISPLEGAPLDRLPASPSLPFRGTLEFQSDPSGAQVVINGRMVGRTPLVLRDLAVGSRAVRLEAPGYQWWSAAVRVVAQETTTVTVRLTQAR
jgi:hypothetical protein